MKAVLETERDRIRRVCDRWAATYRKVDGSGWHYGPDKGEVYTRLRALDLETCTSDDVAAIIGNPGWTQERCNACGKYSGPIVIVGEEPDYESSTARLCTACVREAAALVDKEPA